MSRAHPKNRMDKGQQSLESRVTLLLEAGKDHAVPCFSTSLQRLLSISPEDDGSMESLTEIILNDYGLMNKVLQTVNSFYYNRFGREITTISHAVLLLGFDTIKNIATGMAVISLLEDKKNIEAASIIGKALISAHVSGNLGRGLSGAKEEEIFISALLRQLPRIILAVTSPEAYRELTELEAAQNVAARSCIRKIGYKLKECWNLPDSLASNFEACASLSPSADPVRRALARKTSVLAEKALDGQDITEILYEIGRDFHVEPEQVREVLKKAIKRTVRAVPEIKMALTRPAKRDRKEMPSSLTSQRGQGPDSEPCERTGRMASQTDRATPDSGRRPEGAETELLFMELIQNLMSAVNDTSVPLSQIFLMGIEIIRRVMPVNNVLLCMVRPSRKGLAARFGTGESAGLLKKAISSLDDITGTPIGAALMKEAETVSGWTELLGPMGSALKGAATGQIHCVVSPIVINSRAIGCLIMDNRAGRELDMMALKKIAMIRQLLVSATRLRAGLKS